MIAFEPSVGAAAACGAASAFCMAIALIPARNPLASRLTKMEALTAPSVSRRQELIERLVSDEQRSKLRGRLFAAGWYTIAPSSLALRSIAGAVAGLALALLAALFIHNLLFAAVVGVLLVYGGYRAPEIALDAAINRRREEVSKALPDFLDVLAATVRAGLALNGALIHATESTQGALQEELRTTLAEIRLGRPRGDALRAMGERIGEPQTKVLISSIVQAEELGANLSHVLTALAVDVRHRRWMLAEERAAKLPIKMLLPMMFLMLPSIYIMIFAPVVGHIFAKK